MIIWLQDTKVPPANVNQAMVEAAFNQADSDGDGSVSTGGQ